MLRDLDAAGTLAVVAGARRVADRAEAELLAAVVHWVDLHPVTETDPEASWRLKARCVVHHPDGTVTSEPPLAGAGTPSVAEFAVEELATALDLSYGACLRLVSEAVELCFRLPRLWGLVQAGRLQAWRARKVAEHTTHLGPDAVAFVDRHAAVTGRSNRIPPIQALVHEALCRFEPDHAQGVEEAALAARGVWFEHRDSTATTTLTARLDTLDGIDLENTVADLASGIGRLGDHRPLDIRRATALGMLAHPQRTLDLFSRWRRRGPPPPLAEPGAQRSRAERCPRRRSTCTSPATTSRRPPAPVAPGGGAARGRDPGPAPRLAASVSPA